LSGSNTTAQIFPPARRGVVDVGASAAMELADEESGHDGTTGMWTEPIAKPLEDGVAVQVEAELIMIGPFLGCKHIDEATVE
jgi:hypothetical protein